MEEFKRYPVLVTDNFDTARFPIKFVNEVYVYNLERSFSFNYISPYSIKYVSEGNEIFYRKNKRDIVRKKQALLVNNGTQLISELPVPKEKNELNKGIAIFFTASVLEDIIECFTKKNDIPVLSENRNKTQPIFYDEIISHEVPFLDYCENLFNRFTESPETCLEDSVYYEIAEEILFFQKRIDEKFERINKVRYATKKEIFKRISIAKQIIDDLGLKKYDLNFIAREAHLSKFFLIRCFKEIYNHTPYGYYVFRKIEMAKILLMTKKMSISEVSGLMGYSNIYSFSRQFKHVSGLCPSLFRKNSQYFC